MEGLQTHRQVETYAFIMADPLRLLLIQVIRIMWIGANAERQ
jgi:hypothetical protein